MTRKSLTATISRITAPVVGELRYLMTRSGTLTTLARFVARYRECGADAAWMRRWSGAMGRMAAKLHRTETGTDPHRAWEATPRGHRRHMAYAHDSQALHTAWEHYVTKSGLRDAYDARTREESSVWVQAA